jgi:hypothetical protein
MDCVKIDKKNLVIIKKIGRYVMKAKLYIGILSAVLLPGFLAQSQIADSRYSNNNDAGLVINNYYDNYDYYYASRINRFHRSFSAFSYYSPIFTDSYWYNYEPYTWGLSIYGGGGIGFGLTYNYPFYNYGDNWNYPLFNNYYSWGYDPYYYGYNPFYYNRWYSPLVMNFGIRNYRTHNYYNWYDRNHRDYDFRSVHNNYNNYSNDRSFYNNSRRNSPVSSSSSAGNVSRRGITNRSNSDRISYPGRTRAESNIGNKSENSSIENSQMNRRQVSSPVRNQTDFNTFRRSSTRNQNINTNNSRPVQRSESTSAPSRQRSVSAPGSSSNSGRSNRATVRSSSGNVKSGSSRSNSVNSSKSDSKSSSRSSSNEKGRRR